MLIPNAYYSCGLLSAEPPYLLVRRQSDHTDLLIYESNDVNDESKTIRCRARFPVGAWRIAPFVNMMWFLNNGFDVDVLEK